MYKFLKYAFEHYDFCLVKGCPLTNSLVVLCEYKPEGAAIPESFSTLLDFCLFSCNEIDSDDDDDDFALRTFHFDDLTLHMIWELTPQ